MSTAGPTAPMTASDLEWVAERLHAEFPGALQTESGTILGDVLYLDVGRAGAPVDSGVIVLVEHEVSVHDTGGFAYSLPAGAGLRDALLQALQRIVRFGYLAARRFGVTVNLIAASPHDPDIERLRARSGHIRSSSSGWVAN